VGTLGQTLGHSICCNAERAWGVGGGPLPREKKNLPSTGPLGLAGHGFVSAALELALEWPGPIDQQPSRGGQRRPRPP
jgi:hypothetical protein